jgi:hypothetical protein
MQGTSTSQPWITELQCVQDKSAACIASTLIEVAGEVLRAILPDRSASSAASDELAEPITFLHCVSGNLTRRKGPLQANSKIHCDQTRSLLNILFGRGLRGRSCDAMRSFSAQLGQRSFSVFQRCSFSI